MIINRLRFYGSGCTEDLLDYKFFCFDGEPKYCQVISGRNSTMSIDFFDRDWNHQSFHEPRDYPFSSAVPRRPVCLDKMWEMASLLAKGIPFVRIDFYNINNRIYFGEITFFPTSGFGGFNPDYVDLEWGEWIQI